MGHGKGSPTAKQDLVSGYVRTPQRRVNNTDVGINGRDHGQNSGQNLSGVKTHFLWKGRGSRRVQEDERGSKTRPTGNPGVRGQHRAKDFKPLQKKLFPLSLLLFVLFTTGEQGD